MKIYSPLIFILDIKKFSWHSFMQCWIMDNSLGSLLSGGDLEDSLVSCSLAAALRAEPRGTPEGPRFVPGMYGALLLGEAMLVGTVRVWSQFPESSVCESVSY